MASAFINIRSNEEAAEAMREIVLGLTADEEPDPTEFIRWRDLSEPGKIVGVSMYCTLIISKVTNTRPVFKSSDTHVQLTPGAAMMLRRLVRDRDEFVMRNIGEWCVAMLQRGPKNG